MSRAISIECDAVIFDLDGVLTDSGRAVELAWLQLAGEFGFDLGVLSDLHGVRTIDALSTHLPPEAALAADGRMEELEIELAAELQPVDGALALVTAVPVDRWGIATSCSRALAEARLTAAGLPVPMVMITADDVEAGKPDPAPYLAAMRALEITPDRALVLEDAPAGAASATGAGAQVVGVATTHRLESFNATRWVNDLTEIAVEQVDPLVIGIGRAALSGH